MASCCRKWGPKRVAPGRAGQHARAFTDPGTGKRKESADKPGFVVGSHSSGSCVAAGFKQPTRERRGPRHSSPIWSCSRWGLPCHAALAPHAVRSYRTVSPLPRMPACIPENRVRRHRSAVCFLLHFPSAHAAQALPGTLPCGARTFLAVSKHVATAWPTPAPSLSGLPAQRRVSCDCSAETGNCRRLQREARPARCSRTNRPETDRPETFAVTEGLPVRCPIGGHAARSRQDRDGFEQVSGHRSRALRLRSPTQAASRHHTGSLRPASNLRGSGRPIVPWNR